MAQIIRSQCAAYVKQYAGGGACFQVQSVLAKLSLCRTRALGGQTYQCDDCGEVAEVYHSCGDRHCPLCSGCKRYDFAERAEQLILEGVTYYQVVFTLPGELSEMALANREAMADLLFKSAGASLRKTIREQQGYDPVSMMVLHTWNQRLESHWHVHALVPGGGPSLSGDEWKVAQSPPGAMNSDDYYLVDAISLREAFRKAAMSRLRRLYKSGELKLGGKFEYLKDAAEWRNFCERLTKLDWVSFIQPPPTKTATAEQVVRYLTRYLTGGPISDSRIVTADSQQVTFLAREGVQVGGERRQVPVTLTALEFMRLWCLHIQPDQLTKTRYFGGWCSCKRTQYQATCRRLLGLIEATGASPEADCDTSPAASESASVVCLPEEKCSLPCPACNRPSLRLLGSTPKPSWSSLLNHSDSRCPEWFAKTELEEFCEYLEREHGISYEDWYLERPKESTMGTALKSSPLARQLYFPGLAPPCAYLVESY